MEESLSIIILAHNEADNLPRCLESVADLGALIVVERCTLNESGLVDA